jgi:hypothetical protein
LHRSHACPVRFESASFLFTLPEKSLLAVGRRWCGLLPAWCAAGSPLPLPWLLWCSTRWILGVWTSLSSEFSRFVPETEAIEDANSAYSDILI